MSEKSLSRKCPFLMPKITNSLKSLSFLKKGHKKALFLTSSFALLLLKSAVFKFKLRYPYSTPCFIFFFFFRVFVALSDYFFHFVVDESFSLPQICFWLIENNLRVLIAACDTFRAGAVEQLRTHTRHLNALHPPAKHNGLQMVQLYEKGYGE